MVKFLYFFPICKNRKKSFIMNNELSQDTINRIEKKFKKYSEKIKEVKTVTDENKLFLYSHYKQAISGDNTLQKPFIFDRVEMEKWKAWNERKGMSKNNAMLQYIKKCKELIPSCSKDD